MDRGGLQDPCDSLAPYFFDPALLWNLPVIEKMVLLHGEEEAVARMRSVVDSPPMKAIFEQMYACAPCLCCHYVLLESEAAALSLQIRDILFYITPEGMADTKQLQRTQLALCEGTARPAILGKFREAPAPFRTVARKCLQSGYRLAKRRCDSLGIFLGYCPRRQVLWLAKTPSSAKILRKVAKAAKKLGGAICVKAPEPLEVLHLAVPTPTQFVTVYKVPLDTIWQLFQEAAL